MVEMKEPLATMERKTSTILQQQQQQQPSDNRRPSHVKHDKAILHDFEVAGKEFRNKMSEQLKCLGERTEAQVASLGELQDYLRRRGDIETEYAAKLEKLSKSIVQKHKAEKTKREAWPQHTSHTVWQTLVEHTRSEAKKRQALGELMSKNLTASIESRCDDLTKISKRCREIGSFSHNELNRVLSELQTAMKTYQLCYAEFANVDKKKKAAEEEKKKYEEANAGKFETSRKYRTLSKYCKKREEKYETVRLKCTKARNEYLLCVKAGNAALHRFFAQDLSYLIDCMDLGMDFWLKALLDQVIEERKKLAQSEMDGLAELGTLRSAVDAKADKQKFFEANHQLFMLPKQFEFRPQIGDEVTEVCAEGALAPDLLQRQKQIEKRLEGLRFETDEVWKSLEACEKQILQLFTSSGEDPSKWRSDLLVTYQYYMKKFEFFLLNGNLMERLEARSSSIRDALALEGVEHHQYQSNGHTNGGSSAAKIGTEERRKRAKRIGGALNAHDSRPRPRLFSGSLDEYVEATGESIPLLIVSAIRYLSRFSLRNQGLFRVSGSQSEINRFKEAYERGDDVFADLHDGSESNSVAGVLKLYLRELREPIFPIFLFEQFCDCAKADTSFEFCRRARELIAKLPVSHILLLRFLFSFLSHLCEYADENMMEPHNMAICFGPTLLPIPEGRDQVFYHNYVNELVRNLIIHADEVFPRDLPGPVYDKYAMQHLEDENEHLAYMDNESDDEENTSHHMTNGHQNGHTNGRGGDLITPQRSMLDSTYDTDITSSSTPLTSANNGNGIPSSSVQSSPRQAGANDSQHPSISSRSSNHSSLDAYLKRSVEEQVPPLLKTEMPHKIANELNLIFKTNGTATGSNGERPASSFLRHSNPSPLYESAGEERDYVSPPALLSSQLPSVSTSVLHHQYQDEADGSGGGGNRAMYTSIQPRNSLPSTSANGVRPVGKSSLRDQLQLIRKEQGDDKNETRILSASSSNYKLNEDQMILDARCNSKSIDSSSSSRRTSPETGMERSLETSVIRRQQPDVVSSARPRATSPSLDEIVAAFKQATSMD